MSATRIASPVVGSSLPTIMKGADIQPLAPWMGSLEAQQKSMEMVTLLDQYPPDIQRKALHRLRNDYAHERRTNLATEEYRKQSNETELELAQWICSPLALQRATGSVYHRFAESCRKRELRVFVGTGGADYMRNGGEVDFFHGTTAQSFVVEHDWAAAFNGAKDFEAGEVHYPYEKMCFEFYISGKRVCVVVSEGQELDRILPAVETKAAGWALLPCAFESVNGETIPAHIGDDRFDALRRLCADQIRAICISLEAEVTTTEIVRAPHKLNRSREKSGRAPLIDYHAVRLTHRTRPATLPDPTGDEKRTSPRLHFRRGHWRHHSNHKTWIKWQLVGDPDLGFIDKHYRL